MDFSGYRTFDDAFQAKYADLFDNYPFAAMLIEKQLRTYEAGAVAAAGANIRKLARANYGRRIRAQIAFHLAGLKRDASPTYYLNLDRFDSLKSKVSSQLAGLGLAPLREERGMLMSEMRALHQLATLGGAFQTFMRAAATKGIVEAAADNQLLGKLDRQARKNFALVKAMIQKQQIQLFIADGDTLPFSRMICAAAKELHVPYVVIAHGYIQHPQLVGIAPIYGDYLVAWTEQQALDLRRALRQEEKSRVLYFGYPKDTHRSEANDNQALIVWHPSHDGDLVLQAREIRDVAEALRSAGYGSRLRLHPKDTKAREFRAFFSGDDIEVSNKPLADDLEQSSVVIGSRSSVLVEAAMSGKRVFQLAAYRTTPLECVAPIEVGDTFATALKANHETEARRPFDYDGFLSFLTRIGIRPFT